MIDTTHQEEKKTKRLSKMQKHLLLFVAGLLIAAVGTTAIRFAAIKDTAVHYHANFSLYVNGTKDEFKSFTFYEEVASCNADSTTNAKVRTHMHDNKPGLIHVHDGGVTWGQFFENIGYALGNDLLKNDDGVYITGDDGNKLSFILNGEPTTSIANKVISSEDKLLINYGKDNSSALQQRFKETPKTAAEANTTKDPSACAGAHKLTFSERLKQAIGFSAEKH